MLAQRLSMVYGWSGLLIHLIAQYWLHPKSCIPHLCGVLSTELDVPIAIVLNISQVSQPEPESTACKKIPTIRFPYTSLPSRSHKDHHVSLYAIHLDSCISTVFILYNFRFLLLLGLAFFCIFFSFAILFFLTSSTPLSSFFAPTPSLNLPILFSFASATLFFCV